MKRIILPSVALLAFIFGFLFASAICPIHKDMLTTSHLLRLELAIKDFMKQNGRLPSSLNEMVSADFVKKYLCKDGWGTDFEYKISDGCRISLTSYCGRGLRKEQTGVEARISNVFMVIPPTAAESQCGDSGGAR